jgi:hypothetical protein
MACCLNTRIIFILRYSPHNSLKSVIYSNTIRKGTWNGIIDILTRLHARRSACGFLANPTHFFHFPKFTDKLSGPPNFLFKRCHSTPANVEVKDVCLHDPAMTTLNLQYHNEKYVREGGTFLMHLNTVAAYNYGVLQFRVRGNDRSACLTRKSLFETSVS